MPNDRRERREEYGEDADAELMARAEAVPGSFTIETIGDTIVYTETDARGRVRRAVERLPGPGEADRPLAPLVWQGVEAGT